MKNRFLKGLIASFALTVCSVANAGLIVEYDYSTATSSTNLAATFVDPNFTASALTLNNSSNTASSFGNHFYHNGWDSIFNPNKYYFATIGSSELFNFTNVDFALENTGGTSTYWLRSSLDGFVSNISSGLFGDGLVTNFSVDLSSLGEIDSPITFRWYFASTSVAGFANHECGGVQQQGCGLSDVGQDLRFFGNITEVPEPSTLVVFALGLIGLASRKFKQQA